MALCLLKFQLWTNYIVVAVIDDVALRFASALVVPICDVCCCRRYMYMHVSCEMLLRECRYCDVLSVAIVTCWVPLLWRVVCFRLDFNGFYLAEMSADTASTVSSWDSTPLTSQQLKENATNASTSWQCAVRARQPDSVESSQRHALIANNVFFRRALCRSAPIKATSLTRYFATT